MTVGCALPPPLLSGERQTLPRPQEGRLARPAPLPSRAVPATHAVHCTRSGPLAGLLSRLAQLCSCLPSAWNVPSAAPLFHSWHKKSLPRDLLRCCERGLPAIPHGLHFRRCVTSHFVTCFVVCGLCPRMGGGGPCQLCSPFVSWKWTALGTQRVAGDTPVSDSRDQSLMRKLCWVFLFNPVPSSVHPEQGRRLLPRQGPEERVSPHVGFPTQSHFCRPFCSDLFPPSVLCAPHPCPGAP